MGFFFYLFRKELKGSLRSSYSVVFIHANLFLTKTLVYSKFY